MQITSFLQKCIGIALVSGTILFGSAALIGTINPAKADNPTVVNATGKVMMDQTTWIQDGKLFYYILAWDTETGKSKLFYLNKGEKSFMTAGVQLSSSPLY